jgi:hypothetical protein
MTMFYYINSKMHSFIFRFTLKFTVTSGGVIRYQNKVNPGVITDTRYYTGKTAESTVEFRFDYMEPTHCITNQSTCSASDHPLHLDKDITKVRFSI